jgi:hypothetical protein
VCWQGSNCKESSFANCFGLNPFVPEESTEWMSSSHPNIVNTGGCEHRVEQGRREKKAVSGGTTKPSIDSPDGHVHAAMRERIHRRRGLLKRNPEGPIGARR